MTKAIFLLRNSRIFGVILIASVGEVLRSICNSGVTNITNLFVLYFCNLDDRNYFCCIK
jgi:hypothetical protein